jgi:toxin ParE1/3/4
MAFTTVLDPRAIGDIQQAIDYYEMKQPGLGAKFEGTLNEYLRKLEQHPFFQVRYDNVHCLPIKKYPYMIHFTIDEQKQLITVRAVFNTFRDPGVWKKRT